MNLESSFGATSHAAVGGPSPQQRPAGACGIDFGTSNSAAAIVDRDRAHVLALQDGRQSIPTAVFFSFEDDSVAYGREAMRRHLAHDPGRLMRSLKSILGTTLFEEKTQVRMRRYPFADIVAGFLRFLRHACAPGMSGEPCRVVLGRPAFFVDDDPDADMRAQRQLESAAASAGFTEIAFQFEPIAAALHYERSVTREEIALVADIGGGTSDFSVVRVSPQRSLAADRKADILSCSGIHIGGTDFDRLLSLARLMPLFGFRTKMKTKNMEVPSWYYHDLATWHRVNALYDHKVLPDMRRVRREAVEPDKIDRCSTSSDFARAMNCSAASRTPRSRCLRGSAPRSRSRNCRSACRSISPWRSSSKRSARRSERSSPRRARPCNSRASRRATSTRCS